MKRIVTLILSVLGLSSQVDSDESISFALDYDKMVFLDAENLAEQGILEAYTELRSELSIYVETPSPVEEILDIDTPSYQISFQGENYGVYGSGLDENEGQSWGQGYIHIFSYS